MSKEGRAFRIPAGGEIRIVSTEPAPFFHLLHASPHLRRSSVECPHPECKVRRVMEE